MLISFKQWIKKKNTLVHTYNPRQVIAKNIDYLTLFYLFIVNALIILCNCYIKGNGRSIYIHISLIRWHVYTHIHTYAYILIYQSTHTHVHIYSVPAKIRCHPNNF